MAMLSPMAGLRPWRAARLRVAKVPKPAIETGSPRASASAMVANTAAATLSAVALVTEVRVAALDANSLLFMRYPLAVRSYIRSGFGYGSGCRFAGLRATGSAGCAVTAPPWRGPGGAKTRGRPDATRRPPARSWRPAEACARVARRLQGRGSVRPPKRGIAQDRLEAAERRQVLGGAARDESRAVAVAPELERQGPEEAPGEAFEEGEREPGEVARLPQLAAKTRITH